jgi:hypothetical protein
MQTILKEIILTNIITYDNHTINSMHYNLHGHNIYYTSYLTKNITYEVVKLHVSLAIYIKYKNYIKLNDFKDLIQETCIMKYLDHAPDDVKIFAIKDNLVNLSLIHHPTNEMVNFIKGDDRFKNFKFPSCNLVLIINEDKLNEKEMKKYLQSRFRQRVHH